MPKVTVEIDARWAKLVRSPVYWIVVPLQGVAFTFAPLFLYWAGQGKFYPGKEWIVVPACFAAICIVGFFYLWIGSRVVSQLRKTNPGGSGK